MFSLLCVEGNIPLLGKVEDGNAADTKLNNETLEQVAKLISDNHIDRDNFLYVADCKLVNRANLKLLGESPFVTRLPASYKVHAEAVAAALEADEWEVLGTLNQGSASTSAKRPAAVYKIARSPIHLYGRDYRGIIIHSSNHDKRRHKRIERQLAEAQKKAGQAIKAAQRDTYSCEKDAHAALDKLQKTHCGPTLGSPRKTRCNDRLRPWESRCWQGTQSASHRLSLALRGAREPRTGRASPRPCRMLHIAQ